MTSFDVQKLPFDREAVSQWALLDAKYRNWPVVYTIQGPDKVYVGETLNAEGRLRQHLDSPEKRELEIVRVVVDESFNKSVCLDLESHLIRLFSGDGQYAVMNRNVGITDANYFGRQEYQVQFREVFERLREQGLFSRSIPEIENSDLFKLSPFKALTNDQAVAVEQILEGLFDDIESGRRSTSVIQGNPGTGKTVVGIYLLKLLRDIAIHDFSDPINEDSLFCDFFTPGFVELTQQLRIGLVVPQQSLRESIQRVFKKTPGLSASQVMSAYQVGESNEIFDLLIVDEAHRLNQRANQASAALNKKWPEINTKLFGTDDINHTQLDWIVAKSKHQILLLDTEQSVRPADLPLETTRALITSAKQVGRWYPLVSQMRVRAAEDYVGYIRGVLAGTQKESRTFADYDLRMFDNLAEMYTVLKSKEREVGLCRLVAGYAWPWVSKNNPDAFDIELDGIRLKWNSVAKDWVNSPNSFSEVGSIHTVQGYDLNYAGVMIGPDLKRDALTGRLVVDRANYFDAKGKENNPRLGKEYSDDDLRTFVTNIYAVLLTRGIMGTFIYVCDESLRRELTKFLPGRGLEE